MCLTVAHGASQLVGLVGCYLHGNVDRGTGTKIDKNAGMGVITTHAMYYATTKSAPGSAFGPRGCNSLEKGEEEAARNTGTNARACEIMAWHRSSSSRYRHPLLGSMFLVHHRHYAHGYTGTQTSTFKSAQKLLRCTIGPPARNHIFQ